MMSLTTATDPCPDADDPSLPTLKNPRTLMLRNPARHPHTQFNPGQALAGHADAHFAQAQAIGVSEVAHHFQQGALFDRQ